MNIKMNYSRIFHNSLRELSSDKSSLYIDEWVYAGGDSGRHLKYFDIRYSAGKQPPMHSSHCLCSHYIVENCYIENTITNLLVIVGNCCIKKFLNENNKNRTCGICRTPHRNRKINLCSSCRIHHNFALDIVSQVMNEVSMLTPKFIYSTPNHDNILTEGSYKNMTFREAVIDREYITNIRYRDFKPESNLYLFKQYIEMYTNSDDDIIRFGVYKGKKYKEVLGYKSYVKWVMGIDPVEYTALHSFKKYIFYKRIPK